MADVSIVDKITCVERELGFRQRMYPRWIPQQKITQAVADREIQVMTAILEGLKKERIGEVFRSDAGLTEAQIRRDERQRVLALVQRHNSGVFVRLKAMVEREFGI